ncbi:hypothetical protein DRN73_02285 [Candidatus Pacearchaeota archaeon]|nr:MAG: hypothetical protein DRN73_02285 [Candidatus Pacearchaeota archaeon]
MKWLNKILNLVFPSFCKICNKSLKHHEVLICENCYEKLPFLNAYCKKCGTPIEGLRDKKQRVSFCSNCFQKKLYFDEVFIGFYYKEPISNWILEAKFHRNFVLAFELGKLLRKVIKNLLPDVDYIVPLPLSKKRSGERGYNQSFLIYAGLTDKKFSPSILVKIKDTLPQTRLSKKERWKNVKNAFKSYSSLNKKTILLIDDVITTGATVNEAAKALKLAGAEKVYVCALAKS